LALPFAMFARACQKQNDRPREDVREMAIIVPARRDML